MVALIEGLESEACVSMPVERSERCIIFYYSRSCHL